MVIWSNRRIAEPHRRRAAARAFAAASSRPDAQVFVFGGESGGTFFDDAHRLDVCGGGDQPWIPVPPEGATTPPPARSGHTLTYFDDRGAMAESYYVIGGQGDSGLLGDVWRATWVGSRIRWEQVDTAGTSLRPRAEHVAVYEGSADRIVVFGGRVDERRRPSSELWELRLR